LYGSFPTYKTFVYGQEEKAKTIEEVEVEKPIKTIIAPNEQEEEETVAS